jgi:hypothetical protein
MFNAYYVKTALMTVKQICQKHSHNIESRILSSIQNTKSDTITSAMINSAIWPMSTILETVTKH